jgi:Phage terminase large subunit/Terminase RNaseH-like domain
LAEVDFDRREKRQQKLRLLGTAAHRYRSGVPSTDEDPEVAYGPATEQWKPQSKHLEVEANLRRGLRYNLLVGGARSSKTTLFVKHVIRRALLAPESRHGMFRFRANAAERSLRRDTIPKVVRMCYPRLRLLYHDQLGYATTPEGSEIWWGGLDDRDRVEKILGLEFATLMLNEVSQIRYATVLTVRTRLAQVCRTKRGQILAQQELMDLNPVGKGHYTHREFIQHIDPETRRVLSEAEIGDQYHAFLQPQDNAPNLDARYLESLARAPARYRKRYYEGQYVDDIEGALWTMEGLDRARVSPTEIPDTMDRVVVAIDPSGTSGDEDTRSDDVGIVVAGREGTGEGSVGWLLEDATCNEPPREWATRAIALYHKWGADRIVAEGNFGGAMVREVIDATARAMNRVLPPVELVTASRGKAVRAEPISALCGYGVDDEWVQGRVKHAGEFVELEEELLNFSKYGYTGPRSPNRADAYVWALTDVMLGEQSGNLWGRGDMELVN